MLLQCMMFDPIANLFDAGGLPPVCLPLEALSILLSLDHNNNWTCKLLSLSLLLGA